MLTPESRRTLEEMREEELLEIVFWETDGEVSDRSRKNISDAKRRLRALDEALKE